MTRASVQPRVSILIPAHNEADYIGDCLAALFASDPLPDSDHVEVLVLANGCTDDTAAIARQQPAPTGWEIKILEQPQGGKVSALTAGDAQASGNVLIYLDADVLVEPDLVSQIVQALSVPQPRYASGTPEIAPAASLISRTYGRFWTQLPFVRDGVPGFGLFAMNRAGRNRWQDWPDIIADDTFARLSFTPAERVKVSARYSWPLVEGFRNLVRVRRRQDSGVTELAMRFPSLFANDDKQPVPFARLIGLVASAPLGFVIYALVALAVKSPLFRSQQRWTRGR